MRRAAPWPTSATRRWRCSRLLSCVLAVPPVSEQREIAAWIERTLVRFDELSSEATRAADLLRERRSALIAAAVTGQIDVRNSVVA